MVFEELITIAPELEVPIKSLVRILQFVGGIAAIWLILWMVNFAYSIRRTLLIKKMINKLEENNQKLDKLLRKK